VRTEAVGFLVLYSTLRTGKPLALAQLLNLFFYFSFYFGILCQIIHFPYASISSFSLGGQLPPSVFEKWICNEG